MGLEAMEIGRDRVRHLFPYSSLIYTQPVHNYPEVLQQYHMLGGHTETLKLMLSVHSKSLGSKKRVPSGTGKLVGWLIRVEWNFQNKQAISCHRQMKYIV